LKGILISGFSGAGKSAILKEVQRKILQEHSNIYWRSISSVELLSRLVGGSEELMRGIFADLKDHQPSVLSIEDLHLLFGAKEAASH
jgi:transitional endoplasmic reticulum ATPase